MFTFKRHPYSCSYIVCILILSYTQNGAVTPTLTLTVMVKCKLPPCSVD